MKRATVVLAVAAVAGLVWMTRPSEETRILDRLHALADEASIQAGESPLVRAARGARIARFFTEEARIDLGPPFRTIDGRDALTGLTVALRVPPEGVVVTVLEAAVSFDRRLLIASGSLTVRVTAQSVAGEELFGARAYDVALRQLEGEWLIADLRAVDSASWTTP